MIAPTRLAALVVVLAAVAAWATADACGLEGGPGDSFGAAYPGSLAVAFAAHDALIAGSLLPDPVLEAGESHDRGDKRLRQLAGALPAHRATAAIAVLLIEPGTWTRLTPRAGAWVVTEHVEGPAEGETTLIASELAVRDLTDGRLTAREAMARGLLSVDIREPLTAALVQTFPDRTISDEPGS